MAWEEDWVRLQGKKLWLRRAEKKKRKEKQRRPQCFYRVVHKTYSLEARLIFLIEKDGNYSQDWKNKNL